MSTIQSSVADLDYKGGSKEVASVGRCAIASCIFLYSISLLGRAIRAAMVHQFQRPGYIQCTAGHDKKERADRHGRLCPARHCAV